MTDATDAFNFRSKTARMLRAIRASGPVGRYLTPMRSLRERNAVHDSGCTVHRFLRSGDVIDRSGLQYLLDYSDSIRVETGNLYDEEGIWLTAAHESLQTDEEYYHTVLDTYTRTVRQTSEESAVTAARRLGVNVTPHQVRELQKILDQTLTKE